MSACAILEGTAARQNGKALPCTALAVENAKLRELVRHMYVCMEHYEADGSISCDRCPLDNDVGGCDYERLMAELGIEVDDG